MNAGQKSVGLWLLVVLISCGTATHDEGGAGFRQQAESSDLGYVGELAPGYDAQEIAQRLQARVLGTFDVGNRRFVRLQSVDGGKEVLKSLSEEMRVQDLAGRGGAMLPEGLLNLEQNFEVSIPEGPQPVKRPLSQLSASYAGGADPDDTLYGQQYAPQVTDLPRAWKVSQGKGVRVAVIDSGINTRHEDFASTSFEQGWDYIFQSAYPVTANYDWNGHGTHVAGIIAAGLDNGRGISGVSPQATLIPYRVLDASGRGNIADTSSAIADAVKRGVDVINLSLGSAHYSTALAAAVQQAVSAGVLVVAAAGNDGIVMPNYPAALPGVVAVASSDRKDHISYYSSRGDYVGITAPGEDILSLDASDDRGYVILSGTSMAAPFASGVFALLVQQFPTAQAGQLIDLLEQTAAPAGEDGFDSSYGWGLIRPYRALMDNLPAPRPHSHWTMSVFNQGKAITGAAVINIYTTQQKRLLSLYSYEGKAEVNLPYGSYYYSVNYYGHGSGMKRLELLQPQVQSTYRFELNVLTISTLEAEGRQEVDTLVEVYAHSIDPYNIVGTNDDRGLSFYSTLTVAHKVGEPLWLRVRGYDGSTGDYLLYVSEGEKDLASSAPSLSALHPISPSTEPFALQAGVYYQDHLPSDEPWRDFLLP